MIKKCISIIIIFALLVSMASALAPPKFEPQFFYTTDALVDWISRESFSTYQEGRFKEGLVEVKRNGEILVAPNEDLFDAKRRFIEILEDGAMAYYFYEKEGKGD